MRCDGALRVPRGRAAAALLLVAGLAARAARGEGAAGADGGNGPGGFAPVDPDHRWSFPADHRAHPAQRNEWWYFTGIVETAGPEVRRLGYQLTLFRVGLVRDPPPLDSDLAAGAAVMGHAALTDLATGRHVFSEVLWRAAPPLGGFPPDGPLLAFARAPAGSGGRWSVSLAPGGGFAVAMRDDARGIALDLLLAPEKPLALQGPNGYSRKAAAPGYASLYYSFTRLATAGTVTAGGAPAPVRGTSWMDRERSTAALAPGQVGWDWWSLRLADGRDLMLYALRRPDGTVDWRNGALIGVDGAVTLLAADAWTAEPTGRWESPATGAVYPSGWRVRVPGAGIDLQVRPLVAAAENVSALLPGLAYWEGPVGLVDAAGRAAGEGYVELTGYRRGGRLPL